MSRHFIEDMSKVADMHHYVIANPDYLIMYFGTNDLKESSLHQISMSTANFEQEVNKKFLTRKLIIAELITRKEDPHINTKVKKSIWHCALIRIKVLYLIKISLESI